MFERCTQAGRALLGAALVTLLCACPEDSVAPSYGLPPGALTGGATGGGTGASAGGPTTTGGSTATTATTAGTGTSGSGGDGGTVGGGGDFGTPEDPACDLNGVWAGRQTTFSSALNGDQIASNWYLFTLRQEGTEVTVVDHLDCGIYVKSAPGAVGGIEVNIARATMEILATKNPQTGRKGQVLRSSDGGRCEIRFDRFYSARGASPQSYLPAGPHDPRDLSALQAEVPLPNDQNLAGAEDWNGSAQQGLGVAWVVNGAASGVRWSVQRDWTEWTSDASHVTTAATPLERVILGTRFGNEENVLSTSAGILGGLLAATSTAITNDPRAQVELVLLSTPGGPAHPISTIGNLGDRCLEVQKLLPHLEP